MAGEMNLSLLSRGIGEIKKNGHEKIEVKLEPQDYYNWADESGGGGGGGGKRLWRLPPIAASNDVPPPPRLPPRLDAAAADGGPSFAAASYKLAYIPKTFTTRRGALLLFSEDLAVKNILAGKKRRRRRHARSADAVTFRTVDDLAKGILTYGSKVVADTGATDPDEAKVYLGFIHSRGRKFYERQIKPGFSARRYLGSWSKLWDYSLLCRISEKGLLKQAVQSVTEAGYVVKNDTDLSGIPMPYRILRQWLSSPHAMDEYTFYRSTSLMVAEAVPEAAPGSAKEAERPPMDTSSNHSESGQLKIATIVDLGSAVEISYSKLDIKAKEAVLTELLVKSAITQAIHKHMEYTEAAAEGQDLATATAKAMHFDLMDAVETLVSNGSGGHGGGSRVSSVPPHVTRVELAADLVLPGAPPPASSSFKGSKIPRLKGDGSSKSSSVSWGGSDTDHQQQAMSILPPITNTLHHSAIGAGKKSSASSVISDAYQPLPPIGHQTDATSDKALEGSPATPPASNRTIASSLPPPDDSQSAEDQFKEDAEYAQWRRSTVDEGKLLAEADREASPIHRPVSNASSVSHSEGIRPSHDKAGDGEDHKSVFSHASHFSKHSAATSATHESERGAPAAWKGAAYQEGGDATADGSSLHAFGNEQVVDNLAWASGGRAEQPQPAAEEADSERSVMDQLTEQAALIARAVLRDRSAGHDLSADASMAAELMSEVMSPANHSRTQSISSVHSRLSAANSSISEHLKRSSSSAGTSVHGSETGSRHQHGTSTGTSGTHRQSVAATPAAGGQVSMGASSRRSSKAESSSPGRAATDESVPVPAAGQEQGGGGTLPGQPLERAAEQNTEAAVSSGSVQQMPSNGDGQLTNGEEQPLPSNKATTPAQSKDLEIKAAAGGGGGAGDGSLLVITNKEADSGKGSVKSKKSNKSRKSQAEAKSSKSGSAAKATVDAPPEVKEDPFVVGKVKEEVELQKLYAPVEPPKGKPPPKAGPKQSKAVAEKKAAPSREPVQTKKEAGPAAAKGKKKPAKKAGKKSAVKAAAAADDVALPERAKETTQQEATPSDSRLESQATSENEEGKPEAEPEMEFVIVRDVESDEGESEAADEPAEAAKPPTKFDFRLLQQSLQQSSDDGEAEEEEEEEEDEEDALQNVSNKDARAAKQAAEKERRRQDVERRRREREEQLRRDKEEAERRERVQQQLEEDRKRREEEKRLRKEREEEEERRQEAEEEEREQRQRDAAERDRRREAEYQRHLADLRRRAEEEEARRRELAAQKAQEEAELRRLEEEMLSKMALEERLEYEKRKREEEERRFAAEEEARIRREEEARVAMEAARLLAEESARQQEELRQRLLFQRGLNLEADGLDHAHDITRAFVFSYYELLQWLGVNIPNLADLVQWAGGDNS